MRIGLLHNSILPPENYGGIERIVVNLAYEYRKMGHEVVILSRAGSKMSDFESRSLPQDYKQQSPAEWLPKNLDFLHAHEPLSMLPQIPYLVTCHGNGKIGAEYSTNTNFLSRSHARNHNAKYIVYNGVNPSGFPYVEKKEDYVVFLAKARWRVKNLRSCIDFAKDLGVRLEVIGGQGINSRYVRYHGMIGEKQGKLEILSKARALIYPTNWNEPCALAPLEAMACGTPVLGSDNGCMPELCSEETGVLCQSYGDLIKGWQKVQSLRPEDCRKRVETLFSLERMAKDYLELIEHIQKQGNLDQQPRFIPDASTVNLIYKPTPWNRLRLALTGKI
jgi:glycosyltransferase involved in cell wall biosynthesis